MKVWGYFIIGFFVAFLSSCGDPHEYSIDPAFTDYVARFETEAAKRGKTLNLQTTGLIIEFAKLKDDQAGLCHYEKPIRIEIDSVYWRQISAVNGEEWMKENLIFHELGHGILGRKHLNTTLENDDWKSIMCGGTKVDNRPWNINYRHQRRDYYLDELFTESTPMPDFMSMQLLVDTSRFVQKRIFTFDTNSTNDTGWELVEKTDYSISTENKKLKFVSRFNSSYSIVLTVLNAGINFQNDFSMEMELDCNLKTETDPFGILYVAKTNAGDTTEYFKINRQQKMYPGNSKCYSYHVQLTKSSIQKSEKNKLKLFKINGIIYYFINNTFAYQSEAEIKGNGNSFGFIAPAGATVWVDNFSIAQRSPSGIKSKQEVSNNPVQFSTSILPFESDEQSIRK